MGNPARDSGTRIRYATLFARDAQTPIGICVAWVTVAWSSNAENESRNRRKPYVTETQTWRYAMLWTIVIILLILWLLGLIGGIGGNLIHLLIVIAVIVLIFNLLSGRRSAV
jgi:uncharacterized protein DUF5670